MSTRSNWAFLTGVSVVLLVVVGVSAGGSSSPDVMGRGTRLSKVDPDTPWANSIPTTNNASSEGFFMWFSRSAVSLLRECGTSGESGNDVSICLKLAAVRAIDKLSKMRRELPLVGGVVLVPDNQSSSQSEPISPFPSPKEMPSAFYSSRSLQEKHQWVDKQLVSRVLKLIGSLSLRLHLPSARSISDYATQGGKRLAAVASSIIDSEESANPDTGRKRGHFMNAGMFLGTSLLPIKLSMLALLVGKALMLSTLAFAVPASRFLQSLSSRGGSCH